MNILITGATGFVGKRLCGVLSESGHQLTVLSRNAESAKTKLPVINSAFSWDVIREQPPAEAFENIDAVIHLAGESVNGRWDDAKKRQVRESRILGTRNLVEAIGALDNKPKILISASAIGYYGDRGDEILTESAQPGNDFFAEVCSHWEAEASQAREFNLRVVNLRVGIVLGPDGGALARILPLNNFGLNGPLGSGKQWWAWIHREDLIGLITHALNTGTEGPLNGTSPNPTTQRDFAKTLGKVTGRPSFMPAPAVGLKLLLGDFAQELLSSKRTSAAKAIDSGYQFNYPELELALREILKK